jgi:hypothetical protein
MSTILVGDFVWYKTPNTEEPIRCKVIDVGYGGVANSEYILLKITGCKGRYLHGHIFRAPVNFVFPRDKGE